MARGEDIQPLVFDNGTGMVKMWISKGEYDDESGLAVVHRKCF